MCGISGIFAPDGAPTIREEAIRQMTRTLRHRGPDDEGIFVAPEGAACMAALDKLVASGFLRADERMVIYNTGSGLKYLEAYSELFPR